jgi:dolichyl-phosphate-mannose--protein O-mannosyl transferase
VTVAERTGSALDDRWREWMARPGIRRAWDWGAPVAVVAVAAATRLAGLGHPAELVFDETYYVKDAYTLMNLGYEGSWPEGANDSFNAGDTDVYQPNPSFVAHPPFGKWLITTGLALFGADDPFGWRVGVAVTGILLVVITMLIARGLFHSTFLTVVAGGLLAIDGNAIVLSRVAILDTPLTLLALLGVGAILLDRRWTEARLAAWVTARTDGGLGTWWGPALLWRPWLLAAAVAFGLASATKWSGIYFLAIFGLFVVVSEALLRRRAGIQFWATGAVLKQAPVTFLLLVPLAAATHLATWAGWFATDGGYHRHWIEQQNGEAWTGPLAWVPHALQNWWHYQAAVYHYHVGESSPHGYQANPLTWLFLVRPTSMFYQSLPQSGSSTILDIANPLIWWAGTAALFFLVVRVIRGLIRRERVWREAFILTGIAAGFLPWLLYLHRTVFQFYTIAFEPFLVLALAAAIGFLVGSPGDPESRRVAGLRAVAIFLGLCLAVSIFFWPIWTAQPIPYWFFRLHLWLPSWL